MKQLIALALILSLVGGFSCTDITVYPTTTILLADTVSIDPDIEKFTKFMTASWRCIRSSFTPVEDVYEANPRRWFWTDSIDCNKQRQFAFLKEMKVTRISSGYLKVENTYLCSSPQTTYFQLTKMECCGFTITETDDLKQIIRVLDFISPPNGESIWNDSILNEKGHLAITMWIRTFDPGTFDLEQPGSIATMPMLYDIFIEKNY